jgi:hypothetical protein
MICHAEYPQRVERGQPKHWQNSFRFCRTTKSEGRDDVRGGCEVSQGSGGEVPVVAIDSKNPRIAQSLRDMAQEYDAKAAAMEAEAERPPTE